MLKYGVKFIFKIMVLSHVVQGKVEAPDSGHAVCLTQLLPYMGVKECIQSCPTRRQLFTKHLDLFMRIFNERNWQLITRYIGVNNWKSNLHIIFFSQKYRLQIQPKFSVDPDITQRSRLLCNLH
jgi:hypothetical protein